MVTVFKDVEKRSIARNYNHTSFLSAVSKIFEKLANNELADHLEKYSLFMISSIVSENHVSYSCYMAQFIDSEESNQYKKLMTFKQPWQ